RTPHVRCTSHYKCDVQQKNEYTLKKVWISESCLTPPNEAQKGFYYSLCCKSIERINNERQIRHRICNAMYSAHAGSATNSPCCVQHGLLCTQAGGRSIKT
ncbi:MAG: hypothetical protein IJ985_03070, partial [Akkermansia sp.]|nr:hypothetical protein [Akkermansia sp.]